MPARYALFLLLPLIAAIPAATHPDNPPAIKPLSPAARRWVKDTLSRLTTEEKIGQIVFPTYFGAFESTESKDFKELMSRVERDHIGGFILGTRRGPRGIELSHVYETAVLTNELQAASKLPLLIGADFERGTVMRVDEGTAFPHAMAVGATGRPEDAYAMGRVTAIEGRAMGVHWVFAPVADVNSNPDNPIINIRSFGEDPKRVAEYVAQFVRGVEENGAMATAKHFPGHGDTSIDSHLELPLVAASREQLNAVDFVPFEAAIGAGASSVMTAHLAVPALEPNPDTPATLSERVLTGVLRDQLHFEGLVITDALDMGGVTKGFPPGEVAVRALLAGADVLLMSPVTDATLASVRDAVSSGRVPMTRLDDAVRRLLEAKARLGLDKQREVNVEKLSSVFGRPEFLATAEDIATRGVTLLRNDAGLVPLDPRTTKRVFLLAVSADPDTNPAEPFERELRAQLDSLDSLHVDTKYFRVEETPLPPPESYDLAICAVTVRTADRKGSIGLPANETGMIHALLRAGKPVIMVGLGSPYLVESFPEATTWLAAFSIQDVAQRAAARALLGTFAVSGKLPVSLPGAAPHALRVGDGMTTAGIPLTLQPASADMENRLKAARDVLEQAVAEHQFTGVLDVVYKGQESLLRFGQAPKGPFAFKLMAGTVTPGPRRLAMFDPALLTTALARLVQRKEIALESRLSTILEGVRVSDAVKDWRELTLRQLMERHSGATYEFPVREPGTGGVMDENPPWIPQPVDGVERAEYLLETAILETLTGKHGNEAMESLVFGREKTRPEAAAPGMSTDSDVWWRAMESRTRDLAVVGQMWLNGGIYGHKRLLTRQVENQFLMRRTAGDEAFTAGWRMAPAPGQFFSNEAYGSESADGTSLWVDPAKGLEIVIVFDMRAQVRENGRRGAVLGPVRSRAHDAVFSALGLQPQK